MGSGASKHPGEYESVSTPPQTQRQLNFDPRSPSTGIDRTPIIVPVTPDTLKATPVRVKEKLNQLIDPRSPAEAFVRTPVLTPITFDFNELEEALKQNANKRLNVTPKDTISKEISPAQLTFAPLPDSDIPTRDVADSTTDIVAEKTPPSTPTKTRGLPSTPLAVRSPNIVCPPPAIEVAAAKGQPCLKGSEHTPFKMATNGKPNLRQMAHQQSHARGKTKGQKRLGASVQDENSPLPIHL